MLFRSVSSRVLEKSATEQRAVTTVPNGLLLPSPPTFTTTTIVNGSPNLDPEQIISYEAGYQGWFFKHRLRLRLRADVFFNHLSDLVTNRNTSATTASYVNDPGQANIYGGAAGVEFLATRWLTGFANYSYQEIGQSFSGTARRRAPPLQVQRGIAGGLGQWVEWTRGSTPCRRSEQSSRLDPHRTRRYTNHWSGGTSCARRQLQSAQPASRLQVLAPESGGGYMRDAEVAISAFNALNDTHKEQPLGETIGNRVMGWLTVRF